jgi:hypothetical protein
LSEELPFFIITKNTISIYLFFKKSCPGWGADPGSFDFVYFLIPSFYRWATAAPRLAFILPSTNLLPFKATISLQARNSQNRGLVRRTWPGSQRGGNFGQQVVTKTAQQGPK